MLVAASLGGMLTWLAGPSKGLLLISRQEGYLPPFLQRLNKNGVQQNILVVQGRRHHRDRAGLRADPGRLERLLDLLGDHHAGLPDHVPADVRGGDPAAPQATPTTRAATGRPMLVGLCGVGFAASLAALLVGFVPPSQFGDGNAGRVLPDRRRRRARARAAGAVPVLQVPQALLEAARAEQRR